NLGPTSDTGAVYVFARTATGWSQQALLLASDAAFVDTFGRAVALSRSTLVVGAPQDDTAAVSNHGSAYVFTRSGTTWTQQAKILASDGAANDQFGSAVDADGDTIVVGAPLADAVAVTDVGAAYIYTRAGTLWSEQAKLIAFDAAASDTLGSSVAISGGTIVAGAPGDDLGVAANMGSAYVFVRAGSVWVLGSKLVPADGSAADAFGTAVDIDKDTLLVASPADDEAGTVDRGSVYAFARSGSSWTQQTKMIEPGPAGHLFGLSVALSGDLAALGAPNDNIKGITSQGSTWVFSRIGSQWLSGDLRLLATNPVSGDRMGKSVCISGDTAIVGVPTRQVGLNASQGSALIFVRSGSGWIQQAELTATGGAANDSFGSSVSISGDTAIVGAFRDDVGANVDQGSAFVFTRTGTTWTQQAQLNATGGAAGDFLGISVAISGNSALVGASQDAVGAVVGQGTATVFTRSGTVWTQQAQLTATGGAANDHFGFCVGLSGDLAVVGAPDDDQGTNIDQGGAYAFARTGTTWAQQALLLPAGSGPSDRCGSNVAIDADTVAVASFEDDIGTNIDQGSVAVFVRPASTWTQQAQLIATNGLASDFFGSSVAVSGNTIIVGAEQDDVGTPSLADQGSAYIFTRTGGLWTQREQLVATAGEAGDGFGNSVSMSGSTIVVGASLARNTNQGDAFMFEVNTADLPSIRNDVSGVNFTTLAAAFTPALSGHQITTNEGPWNTIGTLSTQGRSLALIGTGDIRTPAGSILTLTDSTSISGAADAQIGIFGELRAQGFIDAAADNFRLGSRGKLTVRTGTSFYLTAVDALLQGQTRIEQGATLVLSGNASNDGTIATLSNSAIEAGGRITNYRSWTMTAGQIITPLFDNRANLDVFGASAIFGSFTNNTAATTSIRGGTLVVFGSLTNLGTVVGTICSTCAGTPPGMDISGDLTLGHAANFAIPFEGSIVNLGGSFDCAIDDHARFNMALATLHIESTRPLVTLEVMSADIGADVAGLDRAQAAHFPIGHLHIGGVATTLQLVDAHDNAGDGTGVCEALYVETLTIEPGSRLINTTCRIYYNTLTNDGTVDALENLISLTAPRCPADFNQDGGVDASDLDAFFAAWEAGDAAADVNADGGVDGLDVDTCLTAWEAGGC
ncbi:MAG: hypothetical protein NTV94_11290, partial [Planctomycetota bacterium]|nr:hypothetical protein [Planctomycetota bacterium]